MDITGLDNDTQGAVRVSHQLGVPLRDLGWQLEVEERQVEKWLVGGGLGDRKSLRAARLA